MSATNARGWLPRSITARGLILVAWTAMVVAGPACLGARVLIADDTRKNGASADAFLCVALTTFLQSAAPSPEYDAWVSRLADDEGRVRWAGILRHDGTGLEFRRRTSMPREEIFAQVDRAVTAPVRKPLRVDGRPSRRYVLLTAPHPRQQAVLAAIVDLGAAADQSVSPMLIALACTSLIGVVLAFAAFQAWIVRPLGAMSLMLRTFRDGLDMEALQRCAPAELAELACALETANREIRRYRLETLSLRQSVNTTVEARTRAVAQALERAEREASTDPLTQVLNRRTLSQKLPELFDRQRTAGEELAILMIDVDHFKQFNDSHGHHAGDELLAFLGELLRGSIRHNSDYAFRYGGDEFVLALPDTPTEAGVRIGSRLASLFAQRARTLATTNPPPGLSIGVATLHDTGAATCDRLIQCADEAMYTAKRSGRDVAAHGVKLRPISSPVP